MLTKLKTYICGQPENEAGKTPQLSGDALSPCYHTRDLVNRWQGDLYANSAFGQGAFPTGEVQYWMLANRTCQLVVRDGKIKLGHLVFIAVYPLEDFIDKEKKVPEQIGNLLSKDSPALYLPPSPDDRLTEHLAVDFNLVYTVNLDLCPEASQKIVQLTSPFAEHAFQKFARYYYDVGFDDEGYKNKTYKNSLKDYVEQKWQAQEQQS